MKFAVLVSIIYLSAYVYAYSCPSGGQWECNPVSEDYNFVDCVAGVCQCRADQGYKGSAQENDMCYCPYDVYWVGGSNICVNLSRAVLDAKVRECNAAQAQLEATMYSQITNLYSSSIFGLGSQYIVFGAAPAPQVFSPTAKVRLMPFLKELEGNDRTVKQIYSLTAFPTSFNIDYHNGTWLNTTGYVTSTKLEHLAFNGTIAEWRNTFVFTQINGTASSYTIVPGDLAYDTQHVTARFNCTTGKIEFWVSHAEYFGQARNYAGKFPIDAQTVRNQTCNAHQTYCDPNPSTRQFASIEDCYAFVDQLTIGDGWQLDHKNLDCLRVEFPGVQINAAEYCPRIGPNGVCQNHFYMDYFDPLEHLGLVNGIDTQDCAQQWRECQALTLQAA